MNRTPSFRAICLWGIAAACAGMSRCPSEDDCASVVRDAEVSPLVVPPPPPEPDRLVSFVSNAIGLVSESLVPSDNTTPHVYVRNVTKQTTTLVSVAYDGTAANGESGSPSISADGRYVAFSSFASNLVAGLFPTVEEVYVRDLQMQTTTLASVAGNGAPADGRAEYPSISGDGKVVAFQAAASNLVPGVGNTYIQVYARDLATMTIFLVSGTGNSDGTLTPGAGDSRSPSVSSDGSRIAFVSTASFPTVLAATNNVSYSNVWVRDRTAGTMLPASVVLNASGKLTPAVGYSWIPSISGDGHFVAFGFANLGGQFHMYLRDLESQTVPTLVGIDGDGNTLNAISSLSALSADGRYVTFQNWHNGVVDVFVRDRQASTTIRVTSKSVMFAESAIAAGGGFVAYSAQVSGPGVDGVGLGEPLVSHIYVYDLQTGATTSVDVTLSGAVAIGVGSPSAAGP